MNDVMIDLETCDTRQSSVILSCALVWFDRDTGKVGDIIYRKFSQTGANLPRSVGTNTLEWWGKQKQKIRDEAFSGSEELLDLLILLNSKGTISSHTKVWGNGATFDISILEHAFSQEGLSIPWKFWNVRDVRTVMDLATGLVSTTKAKNAHNPVVDCKNQIKYLCKAIEKLTNW